MGQACCGSCGSPFIPNLRLNPPAVPPGWGGAKGGGGGDGKGKGKGKGWGQAQGTGFGVVGTKGWAAGKGQQVSPQAYLGVPPGNFGNFGGKGGGGFGQGVGPVQASLAQGFFGSSKRRRNAAVRVAREDAAAAELAAYSDAESMADIPVGVDSAKCFLASKHHGRVARDLKATNPDASRQCEATQRMLSQCGQARLPPAQRVATLQRQYQARLDELDRLVAQQENITARLSAAQDEAAELSTQLESARTAVLATTPASAAGGDGAAILHQAHQFLASLPPTDGASMQAMQALFQVFQQHFSGQALAGPAPHGAEAPGPQSPAAAPLPAATTALAPMANGSEHFPAEWFPVPESPGVGSGSAPPPLGPPVGGPPTAVPPALPRGRAAGSSMASARPSSEEATVTRSGRSRSAPRSLEDVRAFVAKGRSFLSQTKKYFPDEAERVGLDV